MFFEWSSSCSLLFYYFSCDRSSGFHVGALYALSRPLSWFRQAFFTCFSPMASWLSGRNCICLLTWQAFLEGNLLCRTPDMVYCPTVHCLRHFKAPTPLSLLPQPGYTTAMIPSLAIRGDAAHMFCKRQKVCLSVSVRGL